MAQRYAGVISCLGLLACGDDSSQSADRGGAPENPNLVSGGAAQGHGGMASLAEYYSSLWDLKQHSDLAVLGRVDAIEVDAHEIGNPDRVTASVTQVLWQAVPAEPPKSVAFLLLSGEDEDGEGVRPKVSDQFIVFLKEFAPGMYRESGAGSGRFRVDGGIVKPVVSNAVQLDPGTDVATFESLLATAQRQPCAALNCPPTSMWEASMCRCVSSSSP